MDLASKIIKKVNKEQAIALKESEIRRAKEDDADMTVTEVVESILIERA